MANASPVMPESQPFDKSKANGETAPAEHVTRERQDGQARDDEDWPSGVARPRELPGTCLEALRTTA